MFKKDIEKYNDHFKEYMEFVKTNLRFPNLKEDKFSDGTLMYTWRRYARNKLNDIEVINFDKSIENQIKNNKSLNGNKIRNDTRYKQIIRNRNESYPQTYDAYMCGNNRYHYFDLLTYINIIKILGNNPEEVIFSHKLKLLIDIYNHNFTWEEFHDDYDIHCFGKLIMDAIQSLDERMRNIIIMKYGLESEYCMSSKEIGDILNISREHIRSLLAKALRLLRWPTTLKKLKTKNQNINKAVKDHWYIADLEIGAVHKKFMFHRPIHEMEEVLMTLNEKYEMDVIDPMSEYEMYSVKTYTKYAYMMSDDLSSKMHIPKEDISGNVVYAYTIIYIKQVYKMSTEKYIKQQLAEMQYRIEDEEAKHDKEMLIKAAIEQRKMINDIITYRGIENNFYVLFSTTCSRICKNIKIDNTDKWIDEFNEAIKDYDIPFSCIEESTRILEGIISKYLNYFQFRCRYIPKDNITYFMYLQKTEDLHFFLQ